MWYVNHIPTYCKTLQEEEINEYDGIDKNIDTINLNTKGKSFNKTYNYITSKTTSLTIDKFNADEKILKANENAIFNYHKNYDKIDVTGGILQYPCELIRDSAKYNKAGDDCVRYVFTVLNSIDPQFVERIAKTSKIKWTLINTTLFNNSDYYFIEAMANNGFQIFVSKSNIKDNRINVIGKDFKLEKGDIICRNGHIHIFIGNDNTDSFGWGKVNRDFPAYYSFSIESKNNEYLVKMNKGNNIEYYNKVYRYKGEIKP